MTQEPERQRLTETLLIARDSAGHPRVVDLSGITIELVIPAPKAHSGTADLERRLAEAREGLQFYADQAGYKGPGRGKRSAIQEDAGAIARDTLEAIDDK